MIKEIVESNPFLFNIWYHLYRKNRGVKVNYFNPKIMFLLDGYPRSGNTFATSLVKKIFGKEVLIHHLHAIAPIKISLKQNIPSFILIRDPQEAITSYYLKIFALKRKDIPNQIDLTLLKQLARQYCIYYEYVKLNENKICIINFEDLIENPNNFVDIINKRVYNNSFEISALEIDNAVGSYGGAKDKYGSSKPNAEKEKVKQILKVELIKLPLYQKAVDVYHTLSNQITNH